MSDMLVKLYAIDYNFNSSLRSDGIVVKKACIADKKTILDFVGSHFPEEPAEIVHECECALFNSPISCHIAVHRKPNITGMMQA